MDTLGLQICFIRFVVVPLYETWAEFVSPDAQQVLAQLKANLQW